MPTKPLERLMFAQGGRCFFCSAPLAKEDASVEHLVASARAGSNSDDNCVACCKAVNGLFGSMSLKEKIQVVLNQRGDFQCPNGAGRKVVSARPSPPVRHPHGVSQATFDAVVDNLKARGNARPRRVSTLTASLKNLTSLKLSDHQVADLILHLRATGQITVVGERVEYSL